MHEWASDDGWMAWGYLASAIGGTLWVALRQHHWRNHACIGNYENKGSASPSGGTPL